MIKFRHTTRSSRPDFNFYNFCLDPLNFYIKCCFFAIRLTREVSHFPAFCVTSVKRNQRKERLLRVRLLLAPILSSVSFHSRGGLSQVIAAAGKSLRRNEQACSNIFHLHLHKMTEASRLSKAFDDYSVTSRIKPASLLLIDTKLM